MSHSRRPAAATNKNMAIQVDALIRDDRLSLLQNWKTSSEFSTCSLVHSLDPTDLDKLAFQNADRLHEVAEGSCCAKLLLLHNLGVDYPQ